MKQQILLIGMFLFVLMNTTYAQSNGTMNTDKDQVKTTIEKWNQAMLNGDVTAIKDYFPENGVTFFVSYQKMEEMNVDLIIKSLEGQFKSMAYTNYDLLSDPLIYITENGNTAFVYSTMEIAYKVLDSNKGEKFTIIGLEVLIKENGKWVSVLKTTEEAKEKRKPVVLEQSVLDEFSGSYKSERTGNIFTIENDGKNLISKLGDEVSTYIPQSDYSFYKDRFSQSIVFGRDSNGKIQFFTYIKDNICTVMNRID